MLQELPSELISCIATYLPTGTTGELAQTCNHCYWSILSTLYQDLSITKPEALFALSSKLSTNKLYSERARRYVRTISIADHSQRTLARYAVTSVLDDVLSGWEQQQINDEYYEQQQQQKTKLHTIYSLANILDTLFPHLTDFVMEFDLIAQGLYFGITSDGNSIPSSSSSSSSSKNNNTSTTDFSGHLKLINYRPSHPSHLYSVLAPFAKCTQLTLHTRPYLSLCAAIQDSLLMEEDMDALIKLNMQNLTRLELAYVDDLLHVEKVCTLVQSLPHLEYLSLEWLLPPSLDYFDELCESLVHASGASLCPGPMTRLKGTYFVCFQRDSGRCLPASSSSSSSSYDNHRRPRHDSIITPLLSSMRI